ncbi:MAG: hypothetical protein B1H02_02005 [Candidatus Latescibacteria bacterium 4484_107]|nr:MAG: hypothetical protein B1H02_02005 [Candidatus Latescibacteria bacterium 4484_107]
MKAEARPFRAALRHASDAPPPSGMRRLRPKKTLLSQSDLAIFYFRIFGLLSLKKSFHRGERRERREKTKKRKRKAVKCGVGCPQP